MSEKEVKIRFVVDEQAGRKAKLIIDDLTRSVEKLVQASSRVASAMGGVGGGTNAGPVNVRSGRSPIGGSPFIAAGGGRSGGVVANVLGVQDTSALRSLISGTQQGFNTISTSIKSFVDKSVNDISRLQRAVDGINKTMPGGRGGSGGGGGGGERPPPLPPPPPGNGSPFLQQVQAGFNPFAQGPFKLQPSAKFQFNKGGSFSNILQSVGGIGGIIRASAPLAATIGVIATADKVLNYLGDERNARINQTVNQPFDVLDRRAQVAQPFLRMHAAVNSKDVNYQRAYMDTLHDPKIMGSLGKVQLRAEAVERELFKTGTIKGGAKEILNDIRNFIGEKTGASTDDVFTFLNRGSTNYDQVDKRTVRDIVLQNAVADLDTKAKNQFMAAVENKKTLLNPTESMMLDRVYGGAMGRVQAMRSMGMSTKVVTRRNADGSTYQTTSYEDMEQKLSRGGWTNGDYASGRNQLLGIGLGYSKAVGPIGLVSAGVGGLTNAAQLVGAGGALGGSVASGRAMFQAVQASIGRNGLDVAAGRDLFGTLVQQAVASGQWVGSAAAMRYAGMTAGLVAGGSEVPLDVAGQQQMAAYVGAGMPAFARFTQGTEAPLYQATSLMGGVTAMGGYGAGAEALTKMDPALLTAIARGEDSPWARSLNINQKQAGDYLKYQRRAPLFEVVDDLLAGTQAGRTLSDVRAAEGAGGDFMDVINSRTGARRGRETAKQFQRRRAANAVDIATDLGAAMFASGVAASPQAGAGIFLGQLGQDKDFAPFLRGKGVGAAAPAGAEKAALEREANQEKYLGRIATGTEALVKALAPAESLDKQADTSVKAIAAGAGGVGLPGATSNLIAALEIFKNRLDAVEPRNRKVK